MQDRDFFSKDSADIIKGLAIVLMVIHHTFAFPNRIQNVEYVLLFNNLELYIAEFGRICVFIYLFLSGYGLCYYTSKNNGISYKNIFKRILNLLKIYWIVMFIFVPLGFILNIYKFNIKEFIMNFTTLSSSYNLEWWFINTYIILILIFPILYKLIRNRSIMKIIGISLVIHLTSIAIYIVMPSIDSILITRILRLVLIYQLYFIIGYICCEHKLLDKLNKYMIRKRLDNLMIQTLLILICILIRKVTSISDFIIGPIIIYSSLIVIKKIKIENIFKFLSNHSTNIWLIHSFFCYYYFQKIAFYPKYSILIILWIMTICIGISYIINIINTRFKFKGYSYKLNTNKS